MYCRSIFANVKKVFQLLNDMVRNGQISDYAIGGAIGAVFYVEPFATQDPGEIYPEQGGSSKG